MVPVVSLQGTNKRSVYEHKVAADDKAFLWRTGDWLTTNTRLADICLFAFTPLVLVVMNINPVFIGFFRLAGIGGKTSVPMFLWTSAQNLVL